MSRSISESKGLNQSGANHPPGNHHQFPVKVVEKVKQQAPIAQSEPSDTDLDSSTSSTAMETGTTQVGSGSGTPQRADSVETGPLERRSFGNLFAQIRQKHSVNSDDSTAIRGFRYQQTFNNSNKCLRSRTEHRILLKFHIQISFTGPKSLKGTARNKSNC